MFQSLQEIANDFGGVDGFIRHMDLVAPFEGAADDLRELLAPILETEDYISVLNIMRRMHDAAECMATRIRGLEKTL